VYLAGPIDDVTTAQARGWRASLGAVLNELGYIGFDPAAPWLVQTNQLAVFAAAIDAGNRAVLQDCCAVIANLAGPGRGLGTIREIEFARSLLLPVMAILPDGLAPTVALHDLVVAKIAGDPSEQMEFWADHARIRAIVERFVAGVEANLAIQEGDSEELPRQGTPAQGI
jgi:nucleoside 2-deoxyribosyltransferase